MNNIPISSILFFDIETVPGTANFDDLSERMQAHWDKNQVTSETVKKVQRMCTKELAFMLNLEKLFAFPSGM